MKKVFATAQMLNSIIFTFCNNKIMYDFTWYQSLIQPPLAPPAWIFGPVWTVLYISMAVALFLYARKFAYKKKAWGYILFFTQLLVNFAWTPAFFGVKNIVLALSIIILLDVLVLFTIFEFAKVSKTASRILIPYFIWIIFATYLNIGILFLN